MTAAIPTDAPIRLTSLAHGGGCGCKLSPAVLREILAGMPPSGAGGGGAAMALAFPDLLVGTETSDDAAVWRLNDAQALVATTDFFTPVVDDPRDFGRIAATNALSDIYAMGATPIFALAIVGMPVATLPTQTIRAILEGGAEVCAAAGVPIAGGHSIDSAEPIYGLVALGLARPDRLLKNSTAKAGDQLILTKALGVGVLSAALKQGRLEAGGYETLIASTTQLNVLGAHLGGLEGVHAVTDVTGFGLLGHALEMCRSSGLNAHIEALAAPLLAGAEALARAGVRSGASVRNWESYGREVVLPTGLNPWRRDLLTDPQTSGGLLIAVAPHQVSRVLEMAATLGFGFAARIGEMVDGPPGVTVV